MIRTTQLAGVDKKLYRYVAPLVMDPEVIRANNNYPFKTGKDYTWFIAIDESGMVHGFVPVERRGAEAIINNYYVTEKNREEVFKKLLPAVIQTFATEYNLVSVTLVEDRDTFQKYGFTVFKEWKRYIKMIR